MTEEWAMAKRHTVSNREEKGKEKNGKRETGRIRLSEKQQRFCEEYLADLNATQAAIRAGYKAGNSIRSIAYENLTKPHLAKRIKELCDRELAEIGVTREKIFKELALLAFARITDFLSFGPEGVILFPSENLTPDQRKCIEFICEKTNRAGRFIRFKLFDKVRALQLLGRYHDLFIEKNPCSTSDERRRPLADRVVIVPPERQGLMGREEDVQRLLAEMNESASEG
jgi:phage terminase small subunit